MLIQIPKKSVMPQALFSERRAVRFFSERSAARFFLSKRSGARTFPSAMRNPASFSLLPPVALPPPPPPPPPPLAPVVNGADGIDLFPVPPSACFGITRNWYFRSGSRFSTKLFESGQDSKRAAHPFARITNSLATLGTARLALLAPNARAFRCDRFSSQFLRCPH